MIRKLLSSLVLATLCAGAYAADAENPNPPAEIKKPPVMAPRPPNDKRAASRSSAFTDPVLCRMTLTEEQIKNLDRAFREDLSKRRELAKLDAKEAEPKLKEQAENFKKKIREILTDEQKQKYDAGCKIVEDAEKALTTQVGSKMDMRTFRPAHKPTPRPPEPEGDPEEDAGGDAPAATPAEKPMVPAPPPPPAGGMPKEVM